MKTRRHKCPPHHWIVNSKDVGYCKYCTEVRDFGRLVVTKRQVISLKKILGNMLPRVQKQNK